MSDEGVFPGVYVGETPPTPAIAAEPTAITLFVAPAPPAAADLLLLNSFSDYLNAGGVADSLLGLSLRGFFDNGGGEALALGLPIASQTPEAMRAALRAAFSAGGVADPVAFNLLCAPGLADIEAILHLQEWCKARRAFFIVDAPQNASVEDLLRSMDCLRGPSAHHAALYFPWIETPGGAAPPCGFIAGVMARLDAAKGVWKAPAGVEARIIGASGLSLAVSEDVLRELNSKAVNCLRNVAPHGPVVWGARTLAGADGGDPEWKYVPVRRMALFIENSLSAGLQWTVFEPNTEQLWAQIRLRADEFLNSLFRAGAFAGASPREAFFVRCDASTTTQNDISAGVANVLVGFAPLKPAEFVILKISLKTAGA